MRLLVFLLLFSSLVLADSMEYNGFSTSETQIGNMKADTTFNGFVIKGSLTDGQPISRNGTDGTIEGQIGYLTIISGENLMVCGVITTNTVLNRSLVAVGTCITFGVDDIYLDCDGYSINGSETDGSGVFANGRDNITVKNCEVFGFSGGNSYGLRFMSTSNSNITSSVLRNIGGTGLYLQEGDGNTITNTTSKTNTVRNFNLITTNSVYKNLTSVQSGVGFFINSRNGNFFSNLVSTSSNYEIWLQTSSNNIFDNITTIGGGVGVYFVGSSTNNLIDNSSINTATSIRSANDAQNNKLLNTSFNSSTITWGTCAPCNFTVSWYARVNVTNSTNPLPADVNVSDINEKSAFSSTAGTSGLTPWFTILDYYASSAGNTLFNNYSINASYFGYNLTQSSFNFGGRDYTFNMTLFLTGFIPPLPINVTYGSLVEVFRDLESRKSSEFPARNYFLASLPLLGLAFVGLWKKDWLVS